MYNSSSYDEHTKTSKYILMDVYCNSCFGYAKFSGFQTTKTSANKRLLYVCLRQRKWTGAEAHKSTRYPHYADASNDKSTTFVLYAQKNIRGIWAMYNLTMYEVLFIWLFCPEWRECRELIVGNTFYPE